MSIAASHRGVSATSQGSTGTRFPGLSNTMTKTVSLDNSASTRIKTRLGPLADRFNGFEEHLNLTRTKKKEDEDRRITDLQKQLSNLQAALTLESQSRVESYKALSVMVKEDMVSWTAKVQLPLEAKIAATNQRLDNVTERLETLEREHAADREAFPALIDKRCNTLLAELREFRAIFEREQLAREEKDKRILIKLRDQSNRLKAQFTAEKELQTKKTAELRQDLIDEVNTRAKSHTMLSKNLTDELNAVRADLSLECKERETGDDEIIAAVNHYTAALQDGLKIVSAT